MIRLLGILLAVAAASAQSNPVIERREFHRQNQGYEVALHFPEIRNAKPFNDGVLRITSPLVETLKNAGNCRDGYTRGDYTADTLKNGIVSILFQWESYCRGAAHPSHGMQSINYDSKISRVLSLSDLFRPGADYLPVLSRLAIAGLEGGSLDLTDRNWIRSGAAPADQNFRIFTLTDSALVLHFANYQVAAGTAGPQKVIIPFDALSDFQK